MLKKGVENGDLIYMVNPSDIFGKKWRLPNIWGFGK